MPETCSPEFKDPGKPFTPKVRIPVLLNGQILPGEADRFRKAVQKCHDDSRRLELSEEFLRRCQANGVDLDRFRQDVPVPEMMRDGRPTVLYVGRFDERKGLPVLLRAMPRVIAAVPSVRLIAVGGGVLETECRRLARESGIADHVHFPGRASHDDHGQHHGTQPGRGNRDRLGKPPDDRQQ